VLIRALGSVVSHVSASVGSARYLVLLIFFVLMMLQRIRRDPGDRHIISNFVMMSCLLTDAPDLDETGASVANAATVPPVAPSTGSTPVPDHDPVLGSKEQSIWITRIVGSVETSVIQSFSHLFVYEQPTVVSFSFILGAPDLCFKYTMCTMRGQIITQPYNTIKWSL
jgi:hypothetical protein